MKVPDSNRNIENPINPSIISAPPICSHFQAMNRKMIIINVGILCINNPTVISHKLRPSSNTSMENIAKIKIMRISSTRKDQLTYGLPGFAELII